MNMNTNSVLENTLNLIVDMHMKYKTAAGMEPFTSYLRSALIKCWERINDGSITDDWLEAVCNDIRLNEYICKANAGLLTEEEEQARKKRLEVFLGPCDLPEEVR